MAELSPLICTQCSGKIDGNVMKCPYCGTTFARIVTLKNSQRRYPAFDGINNSTAIRNYLACWSFEDLQLLSWDLGIDPELIVTSAVQKNTFAQRLVIYLDRRGLLMHLVGVIS